MQIDEELIYRIGLTSNEAILLVVESKNEKNLVSCSFALVAMDKDGNVPEDKRLLFIFKRVGRFVASLRNGHWDDKDAKVEKLNQKVFLEIIQSFKGLAIYGWDFINCGDKDFDPWKDRLSFDYLTVDNIGLTNTIGLFQEGGN